MILKNIRCSIPLKKECLYFKVLFMVLLSQGYTHAQTCCADGIYFYSQSQIDQFPISHPNCEIILGNMHIGDSFDATDIDDLTPLLGIKQINGDLLCGNIKIDDLSGFDSLTLIKGDFTIRNIDDLLNFKHLENLKWVEGEFRINANSDLENFTGLNSLESVSELTIRYNPLLKNLTGLDNLKTVTRNLDIDRNASLKTLEGLASLNFVGSAILISENERLQNLTNLSSGEFKELEILSITNNKKLESLEGIDGFDLTFLQELILRNNPNLNLCHVESICNLLNDCRSASIVNNGEDCDGMPEIINACNQASFSATSIAVFPNPADNFLLIQPNCHFDQPLEFEIFDVGYKTILQDELIDNKVDISTLQPGLYFLQFTDWREGETIRFVKK